MCEVPQKPNDLPSTRSQALPPLIHINYIFIVIPVQ